MRSGRQIARREHRRRAAGRGHHEAGAVERGRGIPHRADEGRRAGTVLGHEGVGRLRQPRRQAFGARARPRHDAHLAEPPGACEQLDVRPPLGAGAEHREDVRVGTRKQVGGERARGGGAHPGQRRAVEQRTSTARLRIEQKHRALHRRRAARRVVGKDGHDLGAERGPRAEDGGHDQHDPARALEVGAHRYRGGSARQLAERGAHGAHRVARGQRAADVGCGENANLQGDGPGGVGRGCLPSTRVIARPLR